VGGGDEKSAVRCQRHLLRELPCLRGRIRFALPFSTRTIAPPDRSVPSATTLASALAAIARTAPSPTLFITGSGELPAVHANGFSLRAASSEIAGIKERTLLPRIAKERRHHLRPRRLQRRRRVRNSAVRVCR
jgi:hypothetical protein